MAKQKPFQTNKISLYSNNNNYESLKIQSMSILQILFMISCVEKVAQISEVIIIKERQQQIDQQAREQLREARANFFTNQIRNKLKQVGATEYQQQSAINLFSTRQIKYGRSLSFFIDQHHLQKYHQAICSLYYSYKKIEKQYKKNDKKCLPIIFIIKNELKDLKVLHIEYKLEVNYSISAFDLFKIVHNNKLLQLVIIKGVSVLQFQQFIKKINVLNNPAIKQKRIEFGQQQCWIKNFNPSKCLKLSLNTEIVFYILNEIEVLQKIDDLRYFCRFFDQLSNILAKIQLETSKELDSRENILQNLWKQLKKIKKIRIYISVIEDIDISQISSFRSLLFAELASFTEITQLQFNCGFSYEIGINDFLAIEQILNTLFQNNMVNKLKINSCNNFLLFPKTYNLQHFYLSISANQKWIDYVKQLAKTSTQQLKSIKCLSMGNQELTISDQIFNQLQTLRVGQCRSIFLSNISQKTSNIKHFHIYESTRGNISFLYPIFTKLINLTYLSLYGINCGHSLICTIPSSHLEQLHLFSNYTIKNRDIQVIDARWPELIHIQLSHCSQVTADVWRICKFKGLMSIQFYEQIFDGEGQCALVYLKGRGIKVTCVQQ